MEPLTSSEINQEVGACAALQPKWIRLPDATRVSGMGRSLLYERIREGKIRSVCIRKKNNQRGVRLINVESLNAFIETFGR